MRLVVLGKSNQEIADELFLAVGTVKTHIHNILVKTEQQPHDAHPPLLEAITCQKGTGLFWQVLSGQTPKTAARELLSLAAVF